MKPSIPEVIDRFRAYKAHNPTWGVLHCVLDDGNTQDGFVTTEDEEAARSAGDDEGAELIALLRLMSRTQRKRIALLA